MNIEPYTFSTNPSFLNFEFESEGPNGKIKKVVRNSPQNAGGITYFNLAFGDWNDKTSGIDDTVISNNNDRDKILATVAATIIEFTSHFPDIPVYAQGSNQTRTRLYQIGISTHWKAIEAILDVYGFYNGKWEPFKRNVNYKAFLAQRKRK